MKKKQTLAVIAGCMLVSSAFAQNGIITGKLIDANTKEPIVGATIRIDESLNGTITNNDGTFTIKNLTGNKYTLRISHISYAPVRYSVSSNTRDIVIRMEEAYNNLSQVVVTGTGTHRRMTDSPVPVSVITNRDLRNANVTNIEEALTRLNPSFSFSTTGISTTMTMNGVNQDYILVLVNGKRLTGEDTYQRINLDNVKRIEVLNGAASALYGTDAIGGVINIITDDPKNTIQVNSNTRVSSKGRFAQSVNVDANVGKLTSTTNYNRQQSQGWRLSDITPDSLYSGRLPVMAFYSDNIDQRFNYNFTEKLSAYVRGGFYHHTTRRPEDAYYETKNKKTGKIQRSLAYTYDIDHKSFFYGAGMKYMIDKRAYLEADFYSDNYRSRYEYMGNDIDAKTGKPAHERGETQLSKRTRYYNGTIKGIFDLNAQNRVSTGVEYEVNKLVTLKTSSADPIDKSMYNVAVFLQDEYTMNKHFSVVGGLRYVYHENFKNHMVGNLSLMYKIKGLNLRASYAGGFRTPELNRLYSQYENPSNGKLLLPNPSLKPEKSNYFGVNAEYNNNWMSLAVNAYINRFRDLIDYRTLSDAEIAERGITGFTHVQQYANLSRASIEGVNFTASFHLHRDFNLSLGYAYTHSKDKEHDTPLDKSVRHTGTVNANYTHSWNNYRLAVTLNGRLQDKRYSVRYDAAPAFSMWDISTRHTFLLKNITIEPGIGIENIFNYKDTRPFNYNYATVSPGRAVFANLVIKFKK